MLAHARVKLGRFDGAIKYASYAMQISPLSGESRPIFYACAAKLLLDQPETLKHSETCSWLKSWHQGKKIVTDALSKLKKPLTTIQTRVWRLSRSFVRQ